MEEKNIYELDIIKFDHEGRGLAYQDGKTTFVDNTIPGDKVTAQIIKNKKNYNIAKVLKFINYSDKRIESVCPIYIKCGGCDFLNINYSEQLKFKENKVREILTRFGNVDENKIKPIIYLKDNQFNYRNKITFQVNKKIGMYKKNSYDLIPVDKCYLVNDKINNILKIIKLKIDLKNIKQIIIRYSFYNEKIMVIFDGNKFNKSNLLKISNDVSSIYIKNNNYELIYGDKYLEEKLGNYIFKISPDSFFQINTKMCEKLYDKIVEYGNFKKNEKVLDLYCGTGTIGIYISGFTSKVTGYEINEYAIKDAELNKLNNSIDNIEFYCGNSELSFENITTIDKIIVDPPRNGLNDKTIKGIINVKPCKIIYVSCDPVTLARDLKILREYYNIIEVTPVDMFPNTKHVECVSLLSLKSDEK